MEVNIKKIADHIVSRVKLASRYGDVNEGIHVVVDSISLHGDLINELEKLRNNTIEECAKVCDKITDEYRSRGERAYLVASGNCSSSIRKNKSS